MGLTAKTARVGLTRRGRGRGRRARRSSRPRILRYRWWVVLRSRRGARTALVCLVAVLALAFAALRRMTAQGEAHSPPPEPTPPGAAPEPGPHGAPHEATNDGAPLEPTPPGSPLQPPQH